jgi:hypothetical protein
LRTSPWIVFSTRILLDGTEHAQLPYRDDGALARTRALNGNAKLAMNSTIGEP